MATIGETRNYDKFEMLHFNRDVGKTELLEKSMRKYGWIDAYPLHVYENGHGKLRIKAGHHRFYVAQKIGIPVKYIVCKDTATIFELEKSTRRWTIDDYLNAHIRAGNKHYMEVKKYWEETGIPIGCCISMLAGEAAGSNNWVERFKAGTYRIGDTTNAEMVKEIVLLCKRMNIPTATKVNFVNALSKVVFCPQISVKQMKARISTHPEQLTQSQASVKDYLVVLDTLYNFHSKGKRIPVFFLASETAKERMKSHLFKK